MMTLTRRGHRAPPLSDLPTVKQMRPLPDDRVGAGQSVDSSRRTSLAVSDLGDVCQCGAGQGETRKVTAQLEDQRLDGVSLQGQVVSTKAGIEQHLLQAVDIPGNGEKELETA